MAITKQAVLAKGKGRVLVVENIARLRDDLMENLCMWGYEPVAAVGYGTTLLSDAEDKARSHRCHLALIDMRLINERSRSDTSGLELAQKIAPTVALIVSGFGDRETVRAALKEWGAYDFVGKEDGPERLLRVIESAMIDKWPRFRKGIDIDWSSYALDATRLMNCFFPEDSCVPVDEIDDLIWRLFPNADSIKVGALNNSDSTPSLGIRPRSIVMTVQEDHKRVQIIKLVRRDRHTQERYRFDKYVKDQFPLRHYANLMYTDELWDVFGAVYEHVGSWGDMVRFSDYYRQKPAVDTQTVLAIFGEAWKEQYFKTRNGPPPQKGRSLFHAYRDVWGEGWYTRLKESPELLSRTSADFQDWAHQYDLLDPIAWVKRHVGLDGDAPEQDYSPHGVWTAVLHGDLHGDNCFVDKTRKELWLIDYERSGPGPIIEDWVELENDILTRLACFDQKNRDKFFELVVRVASSSKEEFWTLPIPTTNHVEAIKALDVIREIRKQAGATTGLKGDERQYLWGLLLNVVFRLTLPQGSPGSKKDKECDLTTIERCLLLGGVICRSLENGNRTWPPREWQLPVPPPTVSVPVDLEFAINAANNCLTYSLNGGGKYTHQPVGQMLLHDSSRAILQSTFDRLSTLAKKTPQKPTANEKRQDEETLADIGNNLYDILLSDELKEEYLQFRESQTQGNLLIVSNDPWIPWEIVKPQREGLKRGPAFNDPPLCEKFLLARWLSGPAAPNTLSFDNAVVVRPPSNLEAAHHEEDYLLSLPSQSSHIREMSSLNTVAAILDSFRSGETNLYHFVCHGNIDQTDPDESKLKLEDGFLRVNQITGEKRSGLRKAKPFVFLNACYSGDLGYGLTRLGGWAQRFIDSGASAFIGTLWAVHDQLAATFAVEFYKRLLGLGEHQAMPLARAFHDARLAIKEIDPANPTWLAYVLYGNPDARLSQSTKTQMRLF